MTPSVKVNEVNEVNFDGLIGPTHNYSGLSPGNLASQSHANQISYPKAAALQGLDKMRHLVSLGYQQGIFPPQIRPDLARLNKLGFSGSDRQMVNASARQAPELLAMVYSASSMWAANAATVTPSVDTPDGKVHFTVANLITTAHRSIEAAQTAHCLRTVFPDEQYFCIHDAASTDSSFADEGAANHSRFCADYNEAGVAMFVYGIGGDGNERFPARQSLDASRAVAQQHGILNKSVFVQQNPVAIDAGAFHNDVVAVANGPVLFQHEKAFVDEQIQDAAEQLNNALSLVRLVVPDSEIGLDDAIASYLFNSQLLAEPDGSMQQMRLIAPAECYEMPSVKQYIQRLTEDESQPIRAVDYVDVRQSMSNGGGPACLRLRVVLNEAELGAVDGRFLLDAGKIDQLADWVNRNYRDTIEPADLADPQLMTESLSTLEALEEVLDLRGYYRF